MTTTVFGMVVGIVLIVLGLAALLLGLLAFTKRLPGNSVVGLKVPEVRKSPEVWSEAHRVAGPMWMVAGVILNFAGLIALRAHGWVWILPVLLILVALVAMSLGSNFGARAAVVLSENNECGDSCGCGGGESEPAPAVDVDALRQAVQKRES